MAENLFSERERETLSVWLLYADKALPFSVGDAYQQVNVAPDVEDTNKDHEQTGIIKRTEKREIKAFEFTWLLTTGISFSRIICNLSVSKFVRATVLILPVQS